MFDALTITYWKIMVFIASVMVTLLAGGCAGGSPFAATTITGTPVPQEQALPAAQPGETSQPAKPGKSTIPGKPGSPGDTPQVEIAPGLKVMSTHGPLVKAHQVARLVDPCALHDPKAAATVTGMESDAIMPSSQGLNICELEVTATPRELPTWKLTASVGVDFAERHRQRSTEEQIGDIRFFHEPEPGGTGSDSVCRYVMSFGEQTGIELQVRRSGLKPPPQKPCQIAKDYLTAVGKYWKEPATRDDRVSTPQLRLGGIDPCTGVIAVAADLGEPTMAMLSKPYSCSLVPANPAGSKGIGGVVTVNLTVDTDPRLVLGSPIGKDYQAITVAGRPGVQTELTSPGQKQKSCHITVIADDKVALQADQAKADSPKTLQTVETRSADCALATKAAEAVLAKLR